MSPSEPRENLAAFVQQRKELGDDDWILSRPGVSALAACVTGPKKAVSGADTKTRRSVKNEDAPNGQRPPQSVEEGVSPECDAGLWTPGDLSSKASVEQLRETVCGCMRCPLGAIRTNFVFGAGDPNAGIMFIGEAPGANEDAQGEPFVGRAGKLLTDMIIAMKLRREDVFIANILKCRPPSNRDPQPAEVESCEPILLRQIELIRPTVICALGRISGQTLLRTKSTLGALRGTVHNYHGVKLVVTYHPAAILRNPNWKRPTWEDLKMVRREFDGLELNP